MSPDTLFEVENDQPRPISGPPENLAGCEWPWSPASLIVYAVVLGSFFGSGWMYYENARRLGQKREAWIWLALFGAFGVAAMFAVVYLKVHGRLLGFELEYERTRDTLAILPAAAVALAATVRQWARWRPYRGSNGGPGNQIKHGLIAAVIGISLQVGCALLFLELLRKTS